MTQIQTNMSHSYFTSERTIKMLDITRAASETPNVETLIARPTFTYVLDTWQADSKTPVV